jgi:hypothetical protein
MKKLLICIMAAVMIFQMACGSEKGLAKNDLIFDAGEISISLDSDIAPVLEVLGENYSFSEVPSCVYDGTDKIYSYSDLEIYTYPLNDKDLVDEIVLLSPRYATNKGIKVGDTVGDIVEAYGEDYVREGDIISYPIKAGDPKSPMIYFVIDGEYIISINYYSASNMIAD